MRGLAGGLEEVDDFGGVVFCIFCCHAVGILLPGSFATYPADTAIAGPLPSA